MRSLPLLSISNSLTLFVSLSVCLRVTFHFFSLPFPSLSLSPSLCLSHRSPPVDPLWSQVAEKESVVSSQEHHDDSAHQRWSNMPVRYFRLVDDLGEISPIHEREGESWSWRTFLSYAGPGFLVASIYSPSLTSSLTISLPLCVVQSLIWILVISRLIFRLGRTRSIS